MSPRCTSERSSTSPYRDTSLLPPEIRHTTVDPGAMSASSSAATDSAPAGSAMMPSFWYRSSIAVHTAPSSTAVIDTMSPAAASAA